jgi:coatomer subunit delta
LLAKLVPEYAASLDEEAICRNAFELVFAFDEVISLGIRDNVTIQQVKQNCEMESHEEKLHKMLIQSKINDTKDLMKRKAVEIEKTKLDQQKVMGTGSNYMRSGGFGSAAQKLSGMGGGSDGADAAPAFTRPAVSTAPPKSSGTGPSKGMKLGSSKKNDLLETLAKEGELVERSSAAHGFSSSEQSAAPTEPVSLNVDEKLNVVLNKEGGVESVEIQGTLSLKVHADEFAFLRIALATGDNKAFQFKTHPNIDKGTYGSSNVLGLKDPSRPFPTGSELGVLKWFCKTKDESFVPLTINCWPSISGNQSYINVEYESTATYDLQNVVIAIPVPGGQAPSVNQVRAQCTAANRTAAAQSSPMDIVCSCCCVCCRQHF